MKKKRPTPRRLPSGSWRVQVMVNGQRISVTDPDKNVAQARAMALQAGILEREERKTAMTLETAIQLYIEAKTGILSPSTLRGYDIVKRNRFKGIMKKNIYSLTKKDIQTAVNQERQHASPKTIANAYGLVRPVLKEYGIDVFGIQLPQVIRPKKRYIQPEEIGDLIHAVSGDKHEIPILMALWLGMRRSEILGLCWDCVDEEAGTITVRRTWVQDKDQNMVLREGTKNRTSNRTIHCPDYIMDRLKAMRKGRTEGRVFNISQDVIRRRIHKICQENGITDTTTHGLRHTNAAVMRYAGVSDAHAMQRGGWSEERTYKQTYSYVFDSAARGEDKLVDDFYLEQMKKD